MGCSSEVSINQSITSNFSENNRDPSISGDGKKLAFISERNGTASVQIRNIKNGSVVPLRYFSRNKPHSSPSLSWSGRYLALIVNNYNRKIIAISDRKDGKLYYIPLYGNKIPENLELSPDARKIAIEFSDNGRPQVEIFDLTQIIEPENHIGIN